MVRRKSAGMGILVLAAALVSGACTAPVGIVDTQRVLNESVRALQYQKQLDDREKQMAAELNALAPQVGKGELAARRARYLTELGQMKRDLETQLNQQIAQVAAQIAQENRLRLVLVKGPVLGGGRDITQQVIDKLK